MRHECHLPHVKTFRRSAVVRQVLTEQLSPQLQPIFTQTTKCPSGNANRLESSDFASFKLFNLSAPFLKLLKCASCKSNRKTDTSIEVWFFLLKRFGEVLTGDPNAPAGGLGPQTPPPLYSCKNLRIVCKRPNRRFLWFNPDFTSIAVPPIKSRRRHTFSR